MIGEIYGSKVNDNPITACIFRLKSLRWKLVSILFDCTLQLWLTAHYKVLSGYRRVLSGPSRIWPKYREVTRKIPWRDTGFDCSCLEAGFAKILAKNVFFGKENGIRGRDDWSSRCRIVIKKEGECGIRIRLPLPRSHFVYAARLWFEVNHKIAWQGILPVSGSLPSDFSTFTFSFLGFP